MEVKTILWPTDLSKNSLKAAPQVVSLAQKYQARVILMYVGTDLTTLDQSYGYPSQEHLRHFQDWELSKAKKMLEDLCDKDLKACPMLQVKLVQGEPDREILKAIKEEQADLLVLTTHGKGHDNLDQRSVEFGSVARRVLAQSPIPVHLVNPLMS